MSASEGSESDCRHSFRSCSENIDVWSETVEPVGCLGETDTNRSSDFYRLNGLECKCSYQFYSFSMQLVVIDIP